MSKKSQQLRHIQLQISDLLDEMEQLISGTVAESRATSYWLPHIKTALYSDTQYLGGSMVTCDDTIDELAEEENPFVPQFDIDDDVVVVHGAAGIIIDVDIEERDRYDKTFTYQVDFGNGKTAWFDESVLSAA